MANTELHSHNAELRAENARLKADNAELQAENAPLKADNDELREQCRVVFEKLEEREHELALLKKKQFGSTSEASGSKPKKPPRPKNDAAAQKKRRRNREEREKLPTEEVVHPLEPGNRTTCAACGLDTMLAVEAESSVEYEWVPGRLARRVHQRERAMCTCCKSFVRAPGPVRVVDGGSYGPGFIGRLVVHKMLDCVPLYRQSKMLEREGLGIARSTLVDLFHRAASLIEPIYERMIALTAEVRVVQADETTLKMQRAKKRGWVWTFATALYIVYTYKASRSGDAAVEVLGNSTGVLIVDGYTGYNQVTVPHRRVRAGCNSTDRERLAAHSIGPPEWADAILRCVCVWKGPAPTASSDADAISNGGRSGWGAPM